MASGGYIQPIGQMINVGLSYGPPKPGPEFKGIPFDMAVGEVYGLRAWRVDDYGRLRARHVSGAPAWRPGTNVAGCYTSFTGDIEEHESPDERCNCGFYAYSEVGFIDSQLTGAQTIVGVIKGSGRTLLGTQGFRSEKAEIVAIQNPAGAGEGGKSTTDRKLSDRLKVVYPEVPQLPTRRALLEFAPVESLMPGPDEEAFWDIP